MKLLSIILLVVLVNSLAGQNIWEPINFPDTLRSKAINAEKDGILFIATGEDAGYYGLFRSFDDGNSWELIDADTTSPYVNIFTIKYSDENVLFIGANSSIYRSFNDGDTFEKVFTGADNIIKINFSPENEIYAVGWSYIIRSSDGGNTWETLFAGGNMFFSDIDFGLNGEIYTVGGSYDGPGTGSGFHRSLDHGTTWENIGITDQHLNFIEVNKNGIILVGGDSAPIYISYDKGVSWTMQSYMLTTAMESDNQDNIYAGVNGYYYDGFRFSEDWGSSWTNLNDTILNPYINQISISTNNTIYLQCENLSGQQYQLFKSINPIVSENKHELFSEIRLFPNPTYEIIHLLTNKISQIEHITIYDQNGRQILVNETMEDFIDVSSLHSGFYLIEIRTENNVVRKKLIISKSN